MTNNVFDMVKSLGMDGEFIPNYQAEYPIEFAARVSYYMERYYDYKKSPEMYWPKIQAAVKWTNKSIMLEKLGLTDVEENNPDLFKSTFTKLAEHDSDLVVKSGSVFVTEDLRKSFETGQQDRNEHFEQMWKATHDTIVAESR